MNASKTNVSLMRMASSLALTNYYSKLIHEHFEKNLFFIQQTGYFFRDYVRLILVSAEHQDSAVVVAVLAALYYFVSLPFAWGYILINIATGYLFGVAKGTLVTVATATAGVACAHWTIRLCMVRLVKRWAEQCSQISLRGMPRTRESTRNVKESPSLR